MSFPPEVMQRVQEVAAIERRFAGLFAGAAPLWSSKLDELRAQGAYLGDLVALVLDDGDGKASAALLPKERACADLARIVDASTIANLRAIDRPVALAVVRLPDGRVATRTREVVFAPPAGAA